MHTFVIILQILLALGVIVLMAIQTDKAEQGGVMGLGAAGGRTTGTIDLPVGAERILKPLTKWVAGGFLMASVLAAISEKNLTIWVFLGAVVLYVLAMLYGGLLWQTLTGMRRTT